MLLAAVVSFTLGSAFPDSIFPQSPTAGLFSLTFQRHASSRLRLTTGL